MWKNLDRKTRTLGIKRISKLVSEGITLHEKLIGKEVKSAVSVEQKPAPPAGDFELLTALFDRMPLDELVKKIPSESIITKEDLSWAPFNPQE